MAFAFWKRADHSFSLSPPSPLLSLTPLRLLPLPLARFIALIILLWTVQLQRLQYDAVASFIKMVTFLIVLVCFIVFILTIHDVYFLCHV